ncbi:MAG: response regulator transcription factor [Bacteroidota bacterium]
MISTSVGTYNLPYIVTAGIQHVCQIDQWTVKDHLNLASMLQMASELDLLIVGMDQNLDAELIDYLNAYQPNLMLVLSSESHADIKYLSSLGIKAIINWDCPEEEVTTALKMASKGKKYICDRLLESMLNDDDKANNPLIDQLTEREMEVLQLIANGLTTNHIAQDLHLSLHTVNSHRKNIMKKLQLEHPPQLIAYAWQNDLVNAN